MGRIAESAKTWGQRRRLWPLRTGYGTLWPWLTMPFLAVGLGWLLKAYLQEVGTWSDSRWLVLAPDPRLGGLYLLSWPLTLLWATALGLVLGLDRRRRDRLLPETLVCTTLCWIGCQSLYKHLFHYAAPQSQPIAPFTDIGHPHAVMLLGVLGLGLLVALISLARLTWRRQFRGLCLTLAAAGSCLCGILLLGLQVYAQESDLTLRELEVLERASSRTADPFEGDPDEWSPILNIGSRGDVYYMRLAYFIPETPYDYGELRRLLGLFSSRVKRRYDPELGQDRPDETLGLCIDASTDCGGHLSTLLGFCAEPAFGIRKLRFLVSRGPPPERPWHLRWLPPLQPALHAIEAELVWRDPDPGWTRIDLKEFEPSTELEELWAGRRQGDSQVLELRLAPGWRWQRVVDLMDLARTRGVERILLGISS